MHPSVVPILEDDLRCAVVGVLQGTHNATEAAFHTSRALCDDARNARIKRSSSVRRPFPPANPELFAGELSYDEGVLSGTSDVWTKRGACVFPSLSQNAVPRQYHRRSHEVNARDKASPFQLKEGAFSDAGVLDPYHLPSNNVDVYGAPFYDCVDGVPTAVVTHDLRIMGNKVEEPEVNVDVDGAHFYDCVNEVPTAVQSG